MPSITTREQIAENVRAAKARRRVSDSEIAEAVGLSRSGVNDRLNNKAHFRVHELQAIAEFLDVPFADLVEPKTQKVAAAMEAPA